DVCSSDLTSLSVFNYSDPNGTWSLYVNDRVSGQSGEINGGFILTIYPAPVVQNLPATVTINEDTDGSVTFTVRDFDGSVTNVTTDVLPAFASIPSVSNPSGNEVTLQIHPASNVFG